MPPALAQPAPRLEPGISQQLAQWRARHYRGLRYALELRLDERKEIVAGQLDLRFAAPQRADLILDWRGAPVRALRVNGKPANARHEKEHLVIPRSALKAGENRVQLEFSAPVAVSGTALTRYRDREDGSTYLYSLLVPADASSVFPCFDQPDLKARFTLRLDMPPSWRAVSNAPALEETPGRARFAETEPISTYLFAFAAMKLANPSFSHRSSNQRMVTRLPNHWCEVSWKMSCARRSRSGLLGTKANSTACSLRKAAPACSMPP